MASISAEEKGPEMKAAKKATKVQESSGNVFADLGLRNAQGRLVKADLAHQICQVIAARGLTQTRAAKLMGLDQPKISALRQGKLKGFSAERLFRFLNDLGQEVEITIRPAQQAGRRGDIHVIAAAL
jgi:predicted XRE-type DNA-binding protein